MICFGDANHPLLPSIRSPTKLCSIIPAIRMPDADPSQPLCSALSALQITDRDTLQCIRPAFRRILGLGIPIELLVFRPEVLDILTRGPHPLPGPNAPFAELVALEELWRKEDDLVCEEYRRVMEGLIAWYHGNQSHLSPETRSRIEAFFARMKYHGYCHLVKW